MRFLSRRWTKAGGVLCFAVALGLATACTAKTPAERPDERLYFSLELRRDGKVVASPKLLGQAGSWVRAERRQPGASAPDYQLALLPRETHGGYSVELEVFLPHLRGRVPAFAMDHGEERQLELGRRPGELSVCMLLMRVDSPEFDALMRLSDGDEREGPEAI